MAFKNLQDFIRILEENNELVRIKAFVDTDQEMTEITDRFSKNSGKAILFENTGTDFPVLLNAMGSKKRIELALGVQDVDELGHQILKIFENLSSPKENLMAKLKVLPVLKDIAAWLPKRMSGRGSCQEFEMKDVDLSKLPVLNCWPFDGGPFITFPVVHTIDPENGTHNMGMYRMQVFDKNSTGMHWHLHKDGASHYNKYKALGKKMPVTVTLGGDPAYTYAATAPLPGNIDEFLLAGFLRKQKVKLVKSLTNNIFIPEDVDFVLEGYVDPMEELAWEGPFGDHTGYYSLADYYPRFHVTKISYRKNAVFPATIVGIPPMEDAWIGLATERIFLSPIKMAMVPEIVDMHMPAEGVFHNIVFTSIKSSFPAQAVKVMNALWGAGQMMFNKMLFVFDKNVNLTDYKQLAKEISSRVKIPEDIILSRGPLDVLDHASTKYALGGKMGFDVTAAPEFGNLNATIEKTKILSEKPEIIEIYDELLKEDISIVLIRFEKSQIKHAYQLAKFMTDKKLFSNIKFVVFVEEKAICADLADVVWRVANNTDPARDCFYIQDSEAFYQGTLFIDGTRKTAELDGFTRDWPNIVCSSEAVIQKVDKRWKEYEIGDFLPSPSSKYRKQLYEGEAVVIQ